MNKNIVLAVAKRDLRSWFGNPTGYVFITLFVLIACVALMWSSAFFLNNLANLDTWNAWFPLIAIVFVAAATMNIWASERATGTQELLFTLPGRDFDLQAGKFLAAVGVYTISLVFTAPLPLALWMLGNPDLGQLFANYVGFWLFGVMLVSISMIGSQLTQNGTVALILSALICAAVVYIGTVLGWIGFASWSVNGPLGQFAEFARGMLPLSGFVLFVGLTVAFFYLNLALLARRRARTQMQIVHGGVRFAAGAVAVFALTVIGVQSLPRFDATFEGIHSLGAETKKLLAGLDANKPVYVTAYVSEDVPEQFVQQRKLLLNLIDQFDAIGGSAVEKRIVVPEPYSPEAREAETNFSIRPRPVRVQLPGGGMSEQQMFLAFAVQCGTDEVVNPAIDAAVPLEYELMRSIRTVSAAGRKKVGVLRTDVEFGGGFDMQTFRQKERWQIAAELDQQFHIENVDPDRDYPEGIDCLVVPQPSSLVQEQMDRLRDWMLAGHPTLLLEDPFPIDRAAQGTAPDEPKGGQQARMMGGGGPQKGDIAGLIGAIGLQSPAGQLVWDLSSADFPGVGPDREVVFVRGPGVSDLNPITKGLDNIVMLMSGHVQPAGKEGFTVTPLLQSRAPEVSGKANGIMPKSRMLTQSFMGMQINPNRRPDRRNVDLTMAALVTSKPAEGKDKGVHVIYVADLDLVSDQFFAIRRSYPDPQLRFDNVTFVLNCIDSLVGDETLIELRKRRPVLRKLEAVYAAQRKFEEQWSREKDDAEIAAETKLEEARARLRESVDKIRNDATLDPQSKEVKIVEAEQAENRQLEIETAQIDDEKNKKLEIATHDRDTAKRSVHDRYRITTLFLSIVPALLLGVVTWLRRSSRAAAIVPASRHVSGHAGHGGVK